MDSAFVRRGVVRHREKTAQKLMKPSCKILALFCSVVQFSAVSLCAQGRFVNLDFESARIILDSSSPYYPNAITAANALPGWTITGSVTAPDVFYNDVSLGAPAVSLQGPGSGYPPIQGNYFVLLQGSTAGAPA